MKMNSLLCLVEDLISCNNNHNKYILQEAVVIRTDLFSGSLSIYVCVMYVCENSDCKNYYRTAHCDTLCSYGIFWQQNLSVLWLLRPIKWWHNCKTILVVYWALDIIGFILFPSVQCSMKWTCPFTVYFTIIVVWLPWHTSPVNMRKSLTEPWLMTAVCSVLLGGSCNPTTWRHDIAIPFLKQHSISFYNPVS